MVVGDECKGGVCKNGRWAWVMGGVRVLGGGERFGQGAWLGSVLRAMGCCLLWFIFGMPPHTMCLPAVGLWYVPSSCQPPFPLPHPPLV